MLSWIWAGMMAAAVAYGACSGRLSEVSAGALSGAQSAVELVLAMAGPLLLWSGAAEMARRCGALRGLARLLRRPLARLLGEPPEEAMEDVCANVSANLLGLGNASTPPGLRAAQALGKGERKVPLYRFIVLNTASVQLIPATMAAVRAAGGAAAPFDFCPAVWVTSAGALLAALGSAALLEKVWPG